MAALVCLVSLAVVGAITICSPADARGRPFAVWGIWAECEGVNATLSSRDKIAEMFNRLDAAGFNTVLLQVYRHNRAWYRSSVADATPYRDFYTREKMCPLEYAIRLAHQRGMEIHAWVNMFRLGNDASSMVIKELGSDAVTRDNAGRSMLYCRKEYLPDGGYWLDPGDPAVRAYLISVIREILDRYPDIDGIHLDYIRYPFDEQGKVEYGYARASVSGFRKASGAQHPGGKPPAGDLWNKWRRDQLTHFLGDVKKLVSGRGKKLSAAVIADEEKCRSRALQDWPLWLRSGLLDFAVPMNYGSVRSIVVKKTRTALHAGGGGEKVAVGLGAYKMLDAPQELLKQIQDCRSLGAAGVVLFSYDNMTRHPELFRFLGGRVCGAHAATPGAGNKQSPGSRAPQ